MSAGELASLYKSPRYLTRGGTKNKRPYTLTSGKRCIYKVKLHFMRCDIKSAYFIWKIYINLFRRITQMNIAMILIGGLIFLSFPFVVLQKIKKIPMKLRKN